MTKHLADCEAVYRRDFLKIGTAGLCGLTLADLLRLEAAASAKVEAAPKRQAKAKSVIMFWLNGGPSHMDMWDLKPDAPDTIRGEFKPIASNLNGLQIGEHLPQMAKVMDKCCLVRSVAHTISSHAPGIVWMMTGNKPNPALQYPSLGSVAAKVLTADPGIPPYVNFTQARNGASNAGYLGPACNPFEVEPDGKGQVQVRGVSLPTGVSLGDLEDRNKLLEEFSSKFKKLDESSDAVSGLDKFHQQALDILRADKTRKAFDLSAESDEVRNRFGTDAFGQGALAARRLVEAGVRFVMVSSKGWDTHRGGFNNLKTRLLPSLDKTLSALIADLDQKGLLESTIVYCAGEFGRTPKVNGNGGRDHWARAGAVLLAGGGFKKGHVHGSTAADGSAPNSDPCTPDDVASTIFHCLGIDPKHELTTGTGRPMSLFKEGKVIEKVVG